MKKYKWRGYTYQIAEEDLEKYTGAEVIEDKGKEEPKNKKRPAAKNKSVEEKET